MMQFYAGHQLWKLWLLKQHSEHDQQRRWIFFALTTSPTSYSHSLKINGSFSSNSWAGSKLFQHLVSHGKYINLYIFAHIQIDIHIHQCTILQCSIQTCTTCRYEHIQLFTITSNISYTSARTHTSMRVYICNI